MSFKKINKRLQHKLSVYVPVVFVVRILHSFMNVTLLWHLDFHNFRVKIIEDMKNISCKLIVVIVDFPCYKFHVQKQQTSSAVWSYFQFAFWMY